MSATAELVRPVRQLYTHKCGSHCKLPITLAINFAKNPKHYATMFCYDCKTYRPVEEFHWDSGPQVGT